MKILQAGAPKCGNFWLYQIIQQILERSDKDTTSFIQKHPIYDLAKDWELNYPSQASIDVLEITDLQYRYRISSIFSMPIESLPDYVSKTNHVWTHSPICNQSGEVFNLFSKIIYIIRDPRDRAISASNYYCSDYMLKYFPQEETDPKKYLGNNYEHLLREWVWHVFDYVRLSNRHNIHLVFYEDLLTDFQATLKGITDFLHLDLSKEQSRLLEEAVSFRTLKKENPKHLKKGASGYWDEHLSTEQKEIAEVFAGPLLEHLGYKEGTRDPISNFHSFSEDFYSNLREKIIASQRNFHKVTPSSK